MGLDMGYKEIISHGHIIALRVDELKLEVPKYTRQPDVELRVGEIDAQAHARAFTERDKIL